MFVVFCCAGGAGLRQCESLADAESQLESGGGKGLLLYENPALVLADRFSKQEFSREALKAWASDAEQNLQVLRRQRGKVLVIERPSLQENLVLSSFQSFFPTESPPPKLIATRDAPDKIWHAAGALAVSQDRLANRLLSELQENNAAPVTPLPAAASSLLVIVETLAMLDDKLCASAVRQREEETTRNILVQQVAQLQTSLQATGAAEAELKLLYRSISWRITAPLRKIRRLFPT